MRPELQDEVSIADLLSPKSRKWEDLRAAQSSGYVSREPSISETVPLAVSCPECSSERSRLLRPSIPNNRGIMGSFILASFFEVLHPRRRSMGLLLPEVC